MTHVEVRTLDESVCARVVARNADVADTIVFREVVECFDPWGAVVGDDFGDAAPSAEEVLEEPLHEGAAGLAAKGAGLDETDKGAAGSGEILEPVGGGHVHGVSVDNEKNPRGGTWDGRGKEDLTELAGLAKVASANVPDDIRL